MVELPENFPEYSIMYKTLSNQIKNLEKSKENIQETEKEEIQSKIDKYQLRNQPKLRKSFQIIFLKN